MIDRNPITRCPLQCLSDGSPSHSAWQQSAQISGIVSALLAGIVAFVSPCFLPIVPVFLAYLVGGAPQPAPSRTPVAVGASSAPNGPGAAGDAGSPAGSTVAPEPESRTAHRGRRFAALHASAFITGHLLPLDGGNLAMNPGGTHSGADARAPRA